MYKPNFLSPQMVGGLSETLFKRILSFLLLNFLNGSQWRVLLHSDYICIFFVTSRRDVRIWKRPNLLNFASSLFTLDMNILSSSLLKLTDNVNYKVEYNNFLVSLFSYFRKFCTGLKIPFILYVYTDHGPFCADMLKSWI